MRIGFGYDVHAFAPNRELWLGGIRVPSEQGLLGHSDADVLIHALCDALLGAAALRDIGYHFPPIKGNEFENIDSKIFKHIVFLQFPMSLKSTHFLLWNLYRMWYDKRNGNTQERR